ncbi:sporulation membrane protein YtrI [Virgibacillus senegalensis]|uniref:sporulation membrane protein YtrI n=1 Tax=Virgibacillus senegalensis TaxID=1499679 RepID=UPI00069FAE9E|nr:sporulation membrane protein YtrI [Virgibacillus senegalensis]
MHIPPYYKKESWQRFFAGGFIGAIIAFVIYLYMYGQYYEKWLEDNMNLRSQIAELKKQNEVLLENEKEMNEKTKQKVIVQSVDVEIDNAEQLKLDRLIVHQLQEVIKAEIDSVIGKDIVSLSENDQLLISTLENTVYRVEDINYTASINRLVIAPTLKLHLSLDFSN